MISLIAIITIEITLKVICSSRFIPQAFNTLKNGKWDRKSYVGVELKNKTLGIIGMGRIGAEVAYRAKGRSGSYL